MATQRYGRYFKEPGAERPVLPDRQRPAYSAYNMLPGQAGLGLEEQGGGPAPVAPAGAAPRFARALEVLLTVALLAAIWYTFIDAGEAAPANRIAHVGGELVGGGQAGAAVGLVAARESAAEAAQEAADDAAAASEEGLEDGAGAEEGEDVSAEPDGASESRTAQEEHAHELAAALSGKDEEELEEDALPAEGEDVSAEPDGASESRTAQEEHAHELAAALSGKDEEELEEEAKVEAAPEPEPEPEKASPAPAKVGAAPEDCSIKPEHIDHTVKKIESAKVTQKPFQHVVVKDVFHPDLYACLVSKLPSKKVYVSPGKKSKRVTLQLRSKLGVAIQKDKGVTAEKAETLDEKFWEEFSRAFGGDTVRNLFVAKFTKTLTRRGAPASAKMYHYTLDLARESAPFSPKPHTDSPSNAVSVTFHLPKDDALKEHGPLVLKGKGGEAQPGEDRKCGQGVCKGLSSFEVVKRVPYAPNTMFAHAPCAVGWLGMEPMTKDNTRRDVLRGSVVANQPLGNKGACPTPTVKALRRSAA